MSKIIIRVEGGLVQGVSYDGEDDIQVEVLDMDVGENCTEDELDEWEYDVKRMEAELKHHKMRGIY